MKKKLFHLGLAAGILGLGVAYLAKKTGFFEDDRHLYDEYDAS
ncbi:methanol dehydrogenase [Enterococcus mediterraneensis]|nr:methanol dehydrogenase [Enterococcus mediterraneensis]